MDDWLNVYQSLEFHPNDKFGDSVVLALQSNTFHLQTAHCVGPVLPTNGKVHTTLELFLWVNLAAKPGAEWSTLLF